MMIIFFGVFSDFNDLLYVFDFKKRSSNFDYCSSLNAISYHFK